MQIVFGDGVCGGFAQVVTANVGFAGQAGAGVFFEVTATRVVVGGGATADGFHLLMRGAVDELGIADARGLVEHIVLRSAVAQGGDVAIGIVTVSVATRLGYAIQTGAVGLRVGQSTQTIASEIAMGVVVVIDAGGGAARAGGSCGYPGRSPFRPPPFSGIAEIVKERVDLRLPGRAG